MNYAQVHALTRKVRGRARNYRCVSCGGQAAEWALRPELTVFGESRFSQDIYDYQAMCNTCHARMDTAGQPKPTSGGPGKPKTPSHRAKLAAHLQSEAMRESARQVGSRPKSELHKRRIGEGQLRNKRECISCGKITTPGAMGVHLKGAGHIGWKELT